MTLNDVERCCFAEDEIYFGKQYVFVWTGPGWGAEKIVTSRRRENSFAPLRMPVNASYNASRVMSNQVKHAHLL